MTNREQRARDLFEMARPCFHYAKRGTPDGSAFEQSGTGRMLKNAMQKIADAERSAQSEPGDGRKQGALPWAIDRWNAEVRDRPLQNVHRRTLDGTWRQVIRHFGGDDVDLLGPAHDELLTAAPTPAPQSAPAIPAGMAGVDTETAAWAWLDKKFGTANDDPVDRAYDASEMVDAFHAGHALRITPKQPSAPASDVLREVLDDLQKAEAAYRKAHDLHGDGDRYTGRMWDLMRRAGDKARATLSQPSAPSQGEEREG